MASAAAAAGSGTAEAPADKNLQLYSKHHTNVFNSLRRSIKKEGDMFLFGEPTHLQMKLLLKLYHENVIKNLSGIPNNFSCMFGILEDDKQNLYVTISESGGFGGNIRTDPDFNKKKTMILTLLESANVTVQFPESGKGGMLRNVSTAENKWRVGERGGESQEVNKHGDIRSEITEPLKKKNPNTKKLEVAPFVAENGEIINSLQEVYLYNDDDSDKINIYLPEIRNLPLTVNYVDSIQYLRDRASGNPTFRPFKKYKYENKNGSWKAECNNGHLCTESKLFAYAFQNNLKPISFVAYWVGKGIPPEEHIMAKYCYRTKHIGEGTKEDVLEEIKKLDALATRCTNVLTDVQSITNVANFTQTFRRVIQPIAVACPGCFANIDAYMRGEMVVWNTSNCYKSRRGSPGIGGTRRHKKKSKQKKTRKA